MVGEKTLDELPTFKVLVAGGLEFKDGDYCFKVIVEVPSVLASDEESAIAAASTAIARQLKSRAFYATKAQILERKEPRTLFDTVGGESSEAEVDFDDEDEGVLL